MQEAHITLGGDPEGFLKKDGKVIGSERVIPEGGLNFGYGRVVRDGIQFEMHPNPGSSVYLPLAGIQVGFHNLTLALQQHPGVSISFDGVVDVEKAEILSLSEASQQLLCQPSDNIYALKPFEVDPLKYLKRSAGGHIHIGLPDSMMEYRTRIVSPLDLLVGIPGVLLDRDPMQKERRKLYGRPGEYRTPQHGLEYRTLSNFWLHSPALADFVLGMARTAVNVVFTTILGEGNLEEALMKKVSFRKVIKAIQTNDFDLALEIWKDWVRPFITSYVKAGSGPIDYNTVGNFERVILKVAKDGLKVFGGNPLENWAGSSLEGPWFVFSSK